MIILHHTDDRDARDAQCLQHLLTDMHLSLTTIHTDEVREVREGAELVILAVPRVRLHLREAMLEAARQHFPHGTDVIRPLDGLDAELPVVVVLRPAVLVDDHGADIERAHRVRDIVGLNAKRQIRQSDQLLQLLEGPGVLHILLAVLLTVAVHEDAGVRDRELDELLLLADLRGHDVHALPLLAAQPLLQHRLLLELRLHEDLPRHERGAIVVLLDEVRQDALVRFLGVNVDELMVTADDLPIADEKDLDDAVREGAAHADDVAVLGVVGHDLLPVLDCLDRPDQIPHLERRLEIEVIRRTLHAAGQLLHDILVLSVQEIDGPVHLQLIVRLRLLPDARPVALVDVIVHALIRERRVLRERLVTVPDMEGLPDELDDLIDLIIRGVRTEVAGPVLVLLPHLQDPRVELVRHLDVRIGLVVLQQGVVARLMFLDEIILEHQRLELRIDDDVLEALHQMHHLLDLHGFLIGFLEVLLDAVFQHLRLADIDDLILRAVHDIDARERRQLMELLFDIKLRIISHSDEIAGGCALRAHRLWIIIIYFTTKFRIFPGTKITFTMFLPSKYLFTCSFAFAAATASSCVASAGMSMLPRTLPLI